MRVEARWSHLSRLWRRCLKEGRDLQLGGLSDEAGVRFHHATLAGHLVLAERHDPAQHGAGDGLVEDRLDAAEGDDQTVLDDRAPPLGHAGLVEEGRVLLHLAARQSGVPAHLRLGDGDLLVLVAVGVVAVDVTAVQHVEVVIDDGAR